MGLRYSVRAVDVYASICKHRTTTLVLHDNMQLLLQDGKPKAVL